MSDPGADLPQPLRRTRDGRWLAGVCSGIAQRWGIPVTQVRALFAVAAVLAGLGALAYVACWLVLPVDDADDSPSLMRALASLALLAAACAGLTMLALAAGLATLFGFGWAVVVALAVFLAGTLVAWPIVRPAWVLLPLAAVALSAVAVAATGVRIAPQSGVVLATPHTPREIPSGGYHTGLGDLLVDLRQLEADPDQEVALRLETGVGRTVVALPRDRCFNLDVRYRTDTPGLNFVRGLARRWEEGAGGTSVSLYGTRHPGGSGRWLRASNDPRAPIVKIDFTSVDGELWVRDYPASVGPLYDSDWPMSVQPPPPLGPRKSRIWRQQLKRFDRRVAALTAGACARKAHR